MSTVSGSIVSSTPRSRLANFVSFPNSNSTKSAKDEEWYIPYKGPIEPPRNEDDTFGQRWVPPRATPSAPRKSTASSQATRSFYGGGIGEAPVNTTASTRDRNSAHATQDRTSAYDRASAYSRDSEWGERGRERDRLSIGSFLTFGQSSRRRTEPDIGIAHGLQTPARKSEESRAQPRPSLESYGNAQSGDGGESMFSNPFQPQQNHSLTPFRQHPQSQRRDHPVTLHFAPIERGRERERRNDTARGSMEVSGIEETTGAIPARHPYAVVFPSVVHESISVRQPYRPQHDPINSQTSTSSHLHSSQPHSNISSSAKSQRHLYPSTASAAVSPAAIAAALKSSNKSGFLRSRSGTFSTPNLRALFWGDKEKITRTSSAKPIAERSNDGDKVDKPKLQYMAETWCDALMFPRPRFRAHMVSPPSSPPDETLHSLRRTMSAKVISKSERDNDRGVADATPSLIKHQQTSQSLPAIPSESPNETPSILSPTEEVARQVLAEGALRNHEREAWNEIARASFQNRRSRSLSRARTRKKSQGRARVESDVTRNGDSLRARTLAVELAAEVFRQQTPTISVMNTSTVNSRTESSVGHGNVHAVHNITGAGKVGFKLRAADGTHAASAEAKLEGALLNEKTAKMSVRGRREEAAEADVQFVDIAPLPNPSSHEPTPEARAVSLVTRGSDSLLDVSTMGIAISTPPPHPSPIPDNLPDLSGHPYAQHTERSYQHHAEAGPVPAPYAGPHPTSSDYTRLPREQQASQSEVPRPFATGRFKEASNPSAHAYASVDADEKRESTLNFEEALLSRAGTEDDHGFGEVYQAAQEEEEEARDQPAPTVYFSGIPSLSHTVTTETQHTEYVPEVEPTPPPQETALSNSPTSSQTSPRGPDDLEPYRDLFYKPSPEATWKSRRTPSAELHRVLESHESGSWSEDRIKSSEGLNGLRSLVRESLVHESPSDPPEPREEEEEEEEEKVRQSEYDPQLEGIQEVQLERSASPLPGLKGESLRITTPLRAEYKESPNYPEDIESSRASSIVEPEATEETLRIGSVSLALPEKTEAQRRQSTALSIGDTEDDTGTSTRANRDTVATTTSSLAFLGSPEDFLRTSFVTTTSSTSHMSKLIGDFPRPPLDVEEAAVAAPLDVEEAAVAAPLDEEDPAAATTPLDEEDPAAAATPLDEEDPAAATTPLDEEDPVAATSPFYEEDPAAATTTPISAAAPSTPGAYFTPPLPFRDDSHDRSPVLPNVVSG